jgi:hypothetical protein
MADQRPLSAPRRVITPGGIDQTVDRNRGSRPDQQRGRQIRPRERVAVAIEEKADDIKAAIKEATSIALLALNNQEGAQWPESGQPRRRSPSVTVAYSARSPVRSASSRNSAVPACDTIPVPSAVTTGHEPRPLPFTQEVPLSRVDLNLQQAQNPCETGTSCVYGVTTRRGS